MLGISGRAVLLHFNGVVGMWLASTELKGTEPMSGLAYQKSGGSRTSKPTPGSIDTSFKATVDSATDCRP